MLQGWDDPRTSHTKFTRPPDSRCWHQTSRKILQEQGEQEWLMCRQIRKNRRDFPGGPVVMTSPSTAGGPGLIPRRGSKMSRGPKDIKQKEHCNKFKKDLTNGPHRKESSPKKGRKLCCFSNNSSSKPGHLVELLPAFQPHHPGKDLVPLKSPSSLSVRRCGHPVALPASCLSD